MLALGGALSLLDQADAQGAVGAFGLEAGQCFGVAGDGALQVGACVADVLLIQEDGRNADIDERGGESDAAQLRTWTESNGTNW